jgi:hypothetical protein
MRAQFFAVVVSGVVLAGCGGGGEWVDTPSGDCQESQIEEAKQRPELYEEMGNRTCRGKAMGKFLGEFRCAGSEEDGTRRLQLLCERS